MKANELSWEKFTDILESDRLSFSNCCDPCDKSDGYTDEELYNICEVCPECEELTIDGDPLISCCYSSKSCNTCGRCYCDGSC